MAEMIVQGFAILLVVVAVLAVPAVVVCRTYAVKNAGRYMQAFETAKEEQKKRDDAVAWFQQNSQFFR
jgi:hypothetical protein